MSDIRPKAWSDCYIYYCVKQTLLFYPIWAQNFMYYAQWRRERARKNPRHIERTDSEDSNPLPLDMASSRVVIPLDHRWADHSENLILF
jgi:hypothetical protein